MLQPMCLFVSQKHSWVNAEHHVTVSVDLLGAVHPSLSLSWVTLQKVTSPAFLSSLLTLHTSSNYAECVML